MLKKSAVAFSGEVNFTPTRLDYFLMFTSCNPYILQGSKQLCKIFVGGLSSSTTDDSLKSYFCHYGEIRELFVAKLANGEVSAVDKALEDRFHFIDECYAESTRALSPDETSKPDHTVKRKTLLLAGINNVSNKNDIHSLFKQYGKIDDICIPVDRETNERRGSAFIVFGNIKAAKTAAVQGEVMINNAKVSVERLRSPNYMDCAPCAYGGHGDGRGDYGAGRWGSRTGYGEGFGGNHEGYRGQK